LIVRGDDAEDVEACAVCACDVVDRVGEFSRLRGGRQVELETAGVVADGADEPSRRSARRPAVSLIISCITHVSVTK